MNIQRSASRMTGRVSKVQPWTLSAWLAIVLLLPTQLLGESAFRYIEPAGSAAAFIDSIGLQTHASYIDTPYAKWQRVLDELVRLGVRHVRDALPTTTTFIENHRQLAAAGIRCTCGITTDEKMTADKIVHAARAAMDVEALEAPNECDAGQNCGGGGKTGIAHATGVLPALASAAQILHVPVIGPSFTTSEAYAATGPIAQWVQFNNLHVYFGGRNPGTGGWGAGDAKGHRYGSIDWWIDQSRLNAANKPSLITETGYEAFHNPARTGTIPEDVESTYLLRTLLLAWNHGIQRTFIYEMLDEFQGSGYGLLRNDLSEKPAFTALRNFISLLSDSSKTGSHERLPLSVHGGDPSLCHTLLEKADGSYVLILWLEKSSYDAVTQRRLPVSPESVQVELGNSFGVRTIVSFEGDGSIMSKLVAEEPSALTVNVNERLSVLHIVSRSLAPPTSKDTKRNQRLS